MSMTANFLKSSMIVYGNLEHYTIIKHIDFFHFGIDQMLQKRWL
jgi:hypothetical protein